MSGVLVNLNLKTEDRAIIMFREQCVGSGDKR